jgi:CHASE2 domain-containing sensor protein
MERPDSDKKTRMSAGDWRAKILGVMAITLAGWAFCYLTFTQGLSRFSFDFPMLLKPETHPDEVVIVYMDDTSRIALRQPLDDGLWDRALHVRLLERLTALHARAVIFDVLMDAPWTNRPVDEQFAEAITNAVTHHVGVVLGAAIKTDPGLPGTNAIKFLHAVDPIGSTAPWGETGLRCIPEVPGDMEMDSVVRRQFYIENWTNLAWQTAVILGAAPADRTKDRWINYYGPKGAIRFDLYSPVLDAGAALPIDVSNKVVFVGKAPWITSQGDHTEFVRKAPQWMPSQIGDEFSTPFSGWEGGPSPGVEIHATAFLNLIRGDWLSRLSLPAEMGLILLFGAALGLALPGRRASAALVLCAGFSLVACLGGILLEQQAHWWFSWAVIAFVEVPAGFAWYAFGILRRKTLPGEPAVPPPQVPLSREETLAVRTPAEPEKPEIPDHELLRVIGAGSFGKVWLAKNNALNTFRAVKVVSRAAFQNTGPFDSEFRGIQAFEPISRQHEGFVDILQVGRRDDAGFFYYVMELADDQQTGQNINPNNYVAKTLASERTRRTKLPYDECFQIGLALCAALQNLHERQLLHRDLKPSNIIFVEKVPKLADIGLVITASDAKTLAGTPGFMPTEGGGTFSGDIYSLGKVLYEISTGKRADEYPSLPDSVGGSAEAEQFRVINKIIEKACEPKAKRRYRSAAELQSALKRAAARLYRKQE